MSSFSGLRPVRLTRRRLNASILAAAASAALLGKGASANEAGCAVIDAYRVPEGSHPHDVAPAADGTGVWFTAQGSGRLGFLNQVTRESELIGLGKGSAPHGVIVGPDGAPWITDGGRDEIQRVDPDTQKITRFKTGERDSNLNTAAFDGDGRLWFTGQSGIVGVLLPDNGEVIVAEAPDGRGPYGMCATPAGDVWFVSLAGSYLSPLRLRSGKIRFDPVPPPTSDAGTRRVWSDSSGNLWLSHWNSGHISRFRPESGAWDEWPLPGERAKAYAIFVDGEDIVWVSDFGSNAILRFDPENESFHDVPLPHPEGEVRQLSGRPGEVWGAESATDHLVVIRTVCAGP